MIRFIAALVVIVVQLGRGVDPSHAQGAPGTSGPDKASIQKVVDEICSDGGEWLKCYSLEPSRCESITAAFVEPCVKSVFANSSKNPGVHPISQLLGCFNQEFMRRYGHGEVKSPQCANPMKHLTNPQK